MDARLVCIIATLVGCDLDSTLSSSTDSSPADTQTGPCDLDKPFLEPVQLPKLNTIASEQGATLTPDEKTIYFASNAGGDFDIYVATRSSITEDFGAPIALAEVNSPDNEDMPCIRPDDLKLYFHKAPGLNVDLFVSARLNSAVAFDPPVNLGPVNTPGVEASGCVSTSGQVLYYFSDNGTTGLFRATLDITDTFSSPVELVQLAPSVGALNTEPTPTEDDQTLYFSSFSADGVGAGEIWVSRRPSPGEDFGAPVLVTELNTPQSDRVDWISPDGCQVYITSDRAGGAGGTDLWLASRPPL